MKLLQVNRKHFVSLSNIKKIVIKKSGMFGHDVWIYKKSGFPPILKCLEGVDVIKKRLVNLGTNWKEFEVEYE